MISSIILDGCNSAEFREIKPNLELYSVALFNKDGDVQARPLLLASTYQDYNSTLLKYV